MAAVYPFFRRKALRDIRKHRLLLEFREALSVLASYLGAGYSTENAFRAAVPELGRLLGPDALIVREFRWISQGLGLHRPLEELLLDFAGRSGVDDIGNFAEVFSVAKRSGGELVRIISHTASVIRDKVSIEEEIVTMNSAKRYEQKIMNFMPFGIILYMNLSSPDFFRMLYTSFLGRIVMTGCLLVWCLAVWLADRIMDIEVLNAGEMEDRSSAEAPDSSEKTSPAADALYRGFACAYSAGLCRRTG